MAKRLKLYNNSIEYQIDKNTAGFTQYLPNAVYCIADKLSFYNNVSTSQQGNIEYDERQYIDFEDAEVKRLCAINFGDYRQTITTDNGDNTVTITEKYKSKGLSDEIISTTTREITPEDIAGTVNTPIGVTYKQAAAVTSIGTIFQSNTTIRKFNEFQYFTHVTSLSNNAFNGSGIAQITFPTSLRTIGSGNYSNVFLTCYNLTKMILNEGVTSVADHWVWGSKNITLIDFPSTIIAMSGYGIHPYDSTQKNFNIICRAVNPPALGSSNYLTKLIKVYVPDDSVTAYKAASVWSDIASKIVGLSTYQ